MHVLANNVRETSTTTGTGNIALAGPTGAVPTAVVGQRFDDVLSVNDTFDYAIHHRTLNEWEVGKGKYSASNEFQRIWVIESSNNNNLVNFSAGEKVVWIGPTSWINRQGFGLEDITFNNAINGQDNSARITESRTAAGVNKPIVAPYGDVDWGVITTLGNLGIDAAGQGTALTFSQGTQEAPSTKPNPILRIEKYTNASDSGGQADHGGIDVRVKKVDFTGSNNAYASYFYMEHDSDGTAGGCLYAVKVTNANAERLYGFNVYLEKAVTIPNGIVKGAFWNLTDTSGQDEGWFSSYAEGAFIGAEMSVSSGRAQFGYLIAGSGVAGTGFYTGMLFQENSILPYSFDNNSEAIRIQGGNAAPNMYNGIVFQSGYFRHGISLVGPAYDNGSAIIMAKDDRITFGTSPADGTYVQWTSGNLWNVVGGSVAVDGTQVVGSRATGWTAATGTASRATFDTSTATPEELAQRLKALIDDLISHGLIGS